MKRRFLTILLMFLTLLITGCQSHKQSDTALSAVEKNSCDVFAMDTYMNLAAYGENAKSALTLASKEIYRLESLFSVTLENSDISKINQSAGVPVTVAPDTASLISTGLKYSGLTEGALDLSIYPILKEWGFTTGNYRIPDSETLKSILEHVDYRQIQVNDTQESDPQVTIGASQEIDLGSVAKGYTGDKVINILKENHVSSAIINLGGNVQTLGTKPDGSLWTIAVTNPFDPDTDLCTLTIRDQAVITSGNYKRFFTGEDGKNYCHIMDPAEGRPAEHGLVSVTVIGESGVMCDALSTALYIKGIEGAIEFYRTMQSKTDAPFELILVTEDGEILYTEGLSDTFVNRSSLPASKIE